MKDGAVRLISNDFKECFGIRRRRAVELKVRLAIHLHPTIISLGPNSRCKARCLLLRDTSLVEECDASIETSREHLRIRSRQIRHDHHLEGEKLFRVRSALDDRFQTRSQIGCNLHLGDGKGVVLSDAEVLRLGQAEVDFDEGLLIVLLASELGLGGTLEACNDAALSICVTVLQLAVAVAGHRVYAFGREGQAEGGFLGLGGQRDRDFNLVVEVVLAALGWVQRYLLYRHY